MYKEFDPDRHDRFDQPAKQTMIQFWRDRGFECVENEDVTGVDLLVRKNGHEFCCEVEVRNSWHGRHFSFPDLQLPIRKKKFTKKPTVFAVLNASMTAAAIVSHKVLKNAAVIVKSNYDVQDERFYSIPASEIEVVQI